MRKNNAFNRKITLLRLEPKAGHTNTYTEAAKVTVWADVSEPGVTTKMTALSVGNDVEYSVIMWRREFKGYTHADYEGKRYKIAATGGTDNPLKIKLLLERG